MKHFLFIFSLFILKNAFAQYPSGQKEIHGIIKTCIADSSAFFDSDKIIIELKHKENNSECPNRPKFSHPYDDWPSDVSFDFVKKTFFVSTNKELRKKPNTDIVESLAMLPRYGTVKYNTKKKELTLTLIKGGNWSKVFNAEFNTTDSLFILTVIKRK